jgi:hypothetical protein
MKIRVTDTEKLSAAIAAAEGPRCSARCITAADIQLEVAYITNELDRLLAKKDQVGAAVAVDLNAQTFPGAYKGIPYSTQFVVERFASGLFVTGVFRARCRSHRRDLDLSDAQMVALAERAVERF